VADLSIYLFWTGFATSVMATLLYVGYVASASLSFRRMAAQTSAGTMTVSGATGVPNPGIGRLATSFTAFTVLFLGGQVATRWSATGHAPISNLYEFNGSVRLRHRGRLPRLRIGHATAAVGIVALPIVVTMLFVASVFPSVDIVCRSSRRCRTGRC